MRWKIIALVFMLISFYFYFVKIPNKQIDVIESDVTQPMAKVVPSTLKKSKKIEKNLLEPDYKSVVIAVEKRRQPQQIETRKSHYLSKALGFLDKPTEFVHAMRQGPYWVVGGDMLVDEVKLEPGLGSTDVRAVAVAQPVRWPEGRVPYVISSGVSKQKVLAAFEEFHEKTLIRFVERLDESNYIDFVYDEKQGGCYSYLGMIGGRQRVVLSSKCGTGNIKHELLHSLGFVHEHSREDRDQHIKILWGNILNQYKPQYQMYPAVISNPAELDFDFDSMLMYPSSAPELAAVDAMVTLEDRPFEANRRELSAMDIERISILYL